MCRFSFRELQAIPDENFDCMWIANNAGFVCSKLDLPEFMVLNNVGFKVRVMAGFGKLRLEALSIGIEGR